jgi:predicted enzyme related to lactoylglutathione lyase
MGTVNTIEIESLGNSIEKAKDSGGEVVTEKMTIPATLDI